MYVAATGILAVGWGCVNFTNLVHGMQRGVKGSVKRVKRVSSYVGTQVMEGIHRVSPSYHRSERIARGTARIGGIEPEKTQTNHI